MNWLRWYHGTVSDVKWPRIARCANQSVGVVVAVWSALLEFASEQEDRGSVSGFCCEDTDVLFGFDDGSTAAVVSAMRERGVIVEERIAAWDKRQFDEKNAERCKRYREKSAAATQANEQEKQSDMPPTCPDTSRHATDMPPTCPDTPDTDTDSDSDTEQNKVKRCIPLTGYVSSASPEDATPSAEVIPKMPLSQARKTPECPHERIIALYHEILPEMNPVKVWNETRQKLLRARWREDPARQNLDWWHEYFLLVRASDFLMGKRPGKGGGAPFMADLEWIIRPCNMAKILEGRYSRRYSNGDRKRRDITQMSYEEALRDYPDPFGLHAEEKAKLDAIEISAEEEWT